MCEIEVKDGGVWFTFHWELGWYLHLSIYVYSDYIFWGWWKILTGNNYRVYYTPFGSLAVYY